jgi:uncharacterized protein
VSSRQTAERFLGMYSRQDWDGMRDLLAPGVTWYFPGISVVSGAAVGPEAVIERAQAIAVDHASMQLEEILEGVDGIAIVLENSLRSRGGLDLEQNVVLAVRIENDLVHEIRSFVSDPVAISHFYGLAERTAG